ncbi:hypothetical protein PG987_015998 [Apiospora arundinis]
MGGHPEGGGGGGCVPHLDYCPGLVWESQRRRCCDDIDPRAATNLTDGNDYPYFLLRSEKLCLWCEVQDEMRQSGVHAESDVLETTTIPAPPPPTTAVAAASSSSSAAVKRRKKSRTATAIAAIAGHSCSRYWGETDHHCHENVRRSHRHRHRRGSRSTKQKKKRKVAECGFNRDPSDGNDSDDDDEDGGAPLR